MPACKASACPSLRRLRFCDADSFLAEAKRLSREAASTLWAMERLPCHTSHLIVAKVGRCENES